MHIVQRSDQLPSPFARAVVGAQPEQRLEHRNSAFIAGRLRPVLRVERRRRILVEDHRPERGVSRKEPGERLLRRLAARSALRDEGAARTCASTMTSAGPCGKSSRRIGEPMVGLDRHVELVGVHSSVPRLRNLELSRTARRARRLRIARLVLARHFLRAAREERDPGDVAHGPFVRVTGGLERRRRPRSTAAVLRSMVVVRRPPPSSLVRPSSSFVRGHRRPGSPDRSRAGSSRCRRWRAQATSSARLDGGKTVG